jgi:antitoxin (DNA-binding transcriptional repressor) of toxin-antitoxin stability system
MARLTASKLRENIYRVLDEVLATGEPVEIERKGGILKIIPAKKKPRQAKLDRLEPHQAMVHDPDYYVHIDWSSYWRP